MLMSTRSTASLLTSSDGVVRLCMAMPTVDLSQYFGGSQSTAKERHGGRQPPREGDGWGWGRRECRQTPSARAENPAKPGLTSLAWGERGESPSAPAAASRCRAASLFAGQNLGPLAGEVGGRQVGLGFWVGFALPVLRLGAPGWLLRWLFFIFSVCRGGYCCPRACL